MPNQTTSPVAPVLQPGVIRMLLLVLLWLIFTALPTSTLGDSKTGFTAEAQPWAVLLQSQQSRNFSVEPSDEDQQQVSADPGQLFALFVGLLLWLCGQRTVESTRVTAVGVSARQFYRPLLRAPPQQ